MSASVQQCYQSFQDGQALGPGFKNVMENSLQINFSQPCSDADQGVYSLSLSSDAVSCYKTLDGDVQEPYNCERQWTVVPVSDVTCDAAELTTTTASSLESCKSSAGAAMHMVFDDASQTCSYGDTCKLVENTVSGSTHLINSFVFKSQSNEDVFSTCKVNGTDIACSELNALLQLSAEDPAAAAQTFRCKIARCSDEACVYPEPVDSSVYEQRCKEMAAAQGFDSSHASFSGSYINKGCYAYKKDSASAYAGKAYFSTGSVLQMSSPLTHNTSDTERIDITQADYEAKCKRIAESMGLDATHSSFAGAYTNKGCYFYTTGSGSSYAGKAYYSHTSSLEAMDAPLTHNTTVAKRITIGSPDKSACPKERGANPNLSVDDNRTICQNYGCCFNNDSTACTQTNLHSTLFEGKMCQSTTNALNTYTDVSLLDCQKKFNIDQTSSGADVAYYDRVFKTCNIMKSADCSVIDTDHSKFVLLPGINQQAPASW